MTGPPVFDVEAHIDRARFNSLQVRVIALVAVAVVLDGLDGQLIGFALPSIRSEWQVDREALAPVLAAGLFGMGIGSMIAGYLADLIGRRLALIGSIIVFGVATIAVGFCADLWTLGFMRFVAGIGIGGALPSSSTIVSEFSPTRIRPVLISATIVCVPVGGMLAGLFASLILPWLGWRYLFWIGGAVPILFSAILIFFLPESPRYLACRTDRWPRLRMVLGKMGVEVAENTAFIEGRADVNGSVEVGFGALLAPEYVRNTLALWCAFFLSLLAVYTSFSWLPLVLADQGFSVAQSGSGLTAYNLGGAGGAVFCALLITRVGSRRPMIGCALGGAVSALWLAMTAWTPGTMTGLVVGLAIHGFFVNAVQSTLYAVAAHSYPTRIRATGTAAALFVGRGGAILSAFTGAAILSLGGSQAFFQLLAASIAGVAIMLVLISRHIPRNERLSP